MISYSDSDWVGCKTSWRIVRGGIIVLGGAAVKCWSNRQATAALSSGEDELYAATKAATELIGFSLPMSDPG